MRDYLRGLIGETLPTVVTGSPNTIRDVEGRSVLVATESNPAGARVSLSLVQDYVDRVFDGEGEEVVFEPNQRSAFVGAVLQTIEGVEVLTDPRRARLTTAAHTSPDWQFDELILALELYLRWRPRQPPIEHPDLESLSELLRRLPIHSENTRADTLRDERSVRRKLADFRDPDPDYTGEHIEGGTRVHLVWTQFAGDPAALSTAVEAITAAADDDLVSPPPEEREDEAVEGRILYRQHRSRERKHALVRTKKDAVMGQQGRLACEVCELDFEERYGDVGRGFIEAHHTVPLALGSKRPTKADELALVCPNCHRMLHRSQPMLTIDELRERVHRANRAGLPFGGQFTVDPVESSASGPITSPRDAGGSS